MLNHELTEQFHNDVHPMEIGKARIDLAKAIDNFRIEGLKKIVAECTGVPHTELDDAHLLHLALTGDLIMREDSLKSPMRKSWGVYYRGEQVGLIEGRFTHEESNIAGCRRLFWHGLLDCYSIVDND